MVKIRLMRMGATKRPFYRVVVADSRSPRDGRFIENIGKYHPLEDPSLIDIDGDRALYWLSQGAQPTEQVEHLLRIAGIRDRFAAGERGSRASQRATPATDASGDTEASGADTGASGDTDAGASGADTEGGAGATDATVGAAGEAEAGTGDADEASS
jgi:small subunit ribosomal protein S16